MLKHNPVIKLISLFSSKEKKQLVFLIFAVLIMSMFEVAGIGALAPFMAVVTNPSIIQANSIIAWIFNLGGFNSVNSFVLFFGLSILGLIILSTVVKIIVFYLVAKFVGYRRYSLGLRLFKQYIYQPYAFFIQTNSSELSKNLLEEINQVINGVLRPIMDVIVHGILALAILLFLFIAHTGVAFLSFLLFGTIFGLISLIVRPKLIQAGLELRKSNKRRFKVTSEVFTAIKDVKILGKESMFSKVYGQAAKDHTNNEIIKQVYSTLPSHALQSLSLALVIGFVLVFLYLSNTVIEILPLVAVYGFALQKLIPHLQKMFTGFAQVRYYSHTIDALHKDLTEMTLPSSYFVKVNDILKNPKPGFQDKIEVKNLFFKYITSSENVINDVSLTIRKNSTIGFVGSTGCGKTTLVDVLMGLLVPTSGTIFVDGKRVVFEDTELSLLDPQHSMKLRDWQDNFGYVPQHISLIDDTIANNIAFGIPKDQQDYDSIVRVGKIANLHDFITNELPLGYDTIVGERGIRFSGGQRQRIGIARALYHDPEIIVLDEATSALDGVTEDAVMDAIHNLVHTKTIILIAHRITTLQECDTIFMIEKGQIKTQGSYELLLQSNNDFRELAKVL